MTHENLYTIFNQNNTPGATIFELYEIVVYFETMFEKTVTLDIK